MAVTEAFVTSEKSAKIGTNKGTLMFPVFYLDTPVTVGTDLYIRKDIHDEYWHPCANPRSVWSSYDRIHTTFRSNGGAVAGIKSGSTFYIKVYDTENTEIYSSSATNPAANSCFYPTIAFFIGSDGTPVVSGFNAVANFTVVGNPDVQYVANDTDRFGVVTAPLFNGSARFTITQLMIDIAIAILNDSNIGKEDPFDDGGNTEPGGGNGDFDGTGDKIPKPTAPTLSAVDTGFISLFNPTIGQLQSLSSYMWGNLFDLSTWKKLFADPMQAILGLSIVPVQIQNGGTKTVKVGNIATDVIMTIAASQFVELDCGTINVNEYWGAYLDYEPFTSCEIYLPYIGTRSLKVDDIMGKSVNVYYLIDILSGACTASISCDGCVLYTFSGQCSVSIPITGNDWTNVVNGAINVATSLPAFVAGMTSGGLTSMNALGATSNLANSVMSNKPHIDKSGSIGSMGGMLAVQNPYLILTRPRQAVPVNQSAYTGYPSFMTRGLSQISGYTIVENIHLQNIPATGEELAEIDRLLKSGVVL